MDDTKAEAKISEHNKEDATEGKPAVKNCDPRKNVFDKINKVGVSNELRIVN